MGSLVFVGTLTRPVPHFEAKGGAGIHVLRLDETNGHLSTLSVTADAVNPHYLAFDETSSTLYAASEVMDWPQGRLTAYRFEPATARLAMTNTQPTLGHLTCFVSLDQARQHVVVANYSMRPEGAGPDSAFAVFPVAGGTIKPASSAVSRRGGGPDAVRQERSHAHCIQQLPDGRLAATDLGSDAVLIYAFDAASGRIGQEPDCIIAMPPGAGPRHFVYDRGGTRLFVVNEMASTVSVLVKDGDGFTLGQTVSVLPPDVEAPDRYAAGIVMGRAGDHVYVSNRRPDTISLLRVNASSGELQLAGCWPSEGRTPRSMAMSADGRYLLVGNQDSGAIAVFAIDATTGALSFASSFPIKAPMCVVTVANP